jgi:hypothetical protein
MNHGTSAAFESACSLSHEGSKLPSWRCSEDFQPLSECSLGFLCVEFLPLLLKYARTFSFQPITRQSAAVDSALPGDVIHLAAGRYSETLAINKSLTSPAAAQTIACSFA